MQERITLDLGAASPKQARFYRSRALYTGYGGAKGGGKTHAVRVKALMGALRYPGIRILIVRRAYPELRFNHIEPLLNLAPESLASYNDTRRTLYFINGSLIRFGNFHGGTAEREYQGQEYDWIFLDEATQFTEHEFRVLGSCLRGSGDAPKRFYVTCNPGGAGHSWVKRLFIDREYAAHENAADYEFIFASAEDNIPLLRSSPRYLQMLDALPENLRRAYRDGDWDALAGAYFSEFDPDRHIIEPFRVPKAWRKFRAFDYGLDMLACLWAAVAEDGRCYIYRELRRPNLVVTEAAEEIKRLTPPDEEITATFAPPDIWSRQKDTGRTMAELFATRGLYLVRAGNDRVSGHIQIKELLRGMGGGEKKPGLLFFNTCQGVIGDLRRIEASETNPSDCAVTPHDLTHAVDALRYFASSRAPEPAAAPVPLAALGVDEGYIGY